MGLRVAIWKGPWIILHQDVKLLALTYIRFIYIYIYVYIYMCLYIYMFIYIGYIGETICVNRS
jgi:hypothetical protein